MLLHNKLLALSCASHICVHTWVFEQRVFNLPEQLVCFESWYWLISLQPLANWTIRFCSLCEQKWVSMVSLLYHRCFWQMRMKHCWQPHTLVSHIVQWRDPPYLPIHRISCWCNHVSWLVSPPNADVTQSMFLSLWNVLQMSAWLLGWWLCNFSLFQPGLRHFSSQERSKSRSPKCKDGCIHWL